MPDASKPTVTMRIRIGENELEVSGPRDFVEQKIGEFVEQQSQSRTVAGRAPSAGGPAAQATAPAGKKMSHAQFFKKLSMKTAVERALAAGYYLERYEDAESFTAAEVREAIRLAKIPPPTNPSDAITKNIRKGFMMLAGDKEGKMAFVLTTDGEEDIASRLQE